MPFQYIKGNVLVVDKVPVNVVVVLGLLFPAVCINPAPISSAIETALKVGDVPPVDIP